MECKAHAGMLLTPALTDLQAWQAVTGTHGHDQFCSVGRRSGHACAPLSADAFMLPEGPVSFRCCKLLRLLTAAILQQLVRAVHFQANLCNCQGCVLKMVLGALLSQFGELASAGASAAHSTCQHRLPSQVRKYEQVSRLGPWSHQMLVVSAARSAGDEAVSRHKLQRTGSSCHRQAHSATLSVSVPPCISFCLTA